MGRTLLLTGRPGVGKTTVIKQVAKTLGDQAGGFYTEEMRGHDGHRVGFRLVTLEGDEAVMAHVDLRGQQHPRVSRYGVDVDAIERVGVAALQDTATSNRVVIVDEIGKMELFSDAFKEAVEQAVTGDARVLGTVTRSRRQWVDELKADNRVTVWEVTVENRDDLPERIRRWL
jgi:nucleoside-triphosphatase